MMGGSSKPAAERAARIGDGFIPSQPEVWDFYRDEVSRLGKPDPGPCPIGDTVIALATDTERGLGGDGPLLPPRDQRLRRLAGPGRHRKPVPHGQPARRAACQRRYRVLTPEEYVEEQKASSFPFGIFHPLCGGMPPELAWSSLRLFEPRCSRRSAERGAPSDGRSTHASSVLGSTWMRSWA